MLPFQAQKRNMVFLCALLNQNILHPLPPPLFITKRINQAQGVTVPGPRRKRIIPLTSTHGWLGKGMPISAYYRFYVEVAPGPLRTMEKRLGEYSK